MTTTINAVTSTGLVQTSDGSGVIKVQSNGVTTNALAWVNFNGTTSPGTIRSQYNVSSVTKNGTGDYTLNFTSTLSDANYAVVGNNEMVAATTYGFFGPYTGGQTSSSCRVTSLTPAGIAFDRTYCNVAIFGN